MEANSGLKKSEKLLTLTLTWLGENCLQPIDCFVA